MKRISTFICAIIVAAFTFSPTYATDCLVNPGSETTSYALPIYFRDNNTYGCITQQIYLASELTSRSATETDVTAVTFYYSCAAGAGTDPISRDIKVYLLQIPAGTTMYDFENGNRSKFFGDGNNKPGTLVFEGEFAIPALESGASGTKKIPFDNAFAWDGTSNLVLTIFDMSETSNTIDGGLSSLNPYNHLRFTISKTGNANPRFLHDVWRTNITRQDTREQWMSNIKRDYGATYGSSTQSSARSYVAKATFTILTPIPQPTSPNASSITSSSATINWTAVVGADSYEVRYGTTSGNLGAATDVGNITSHSLTELEEETTYYYQVRAIKGSQKSAWTDEASFTTLAEAPHTHNGITFSKWNSETSMPPSGNYYLANDVELSANASISENLNLCLNGHNILTSSHCIIVPDGVTLAIYDNEGSGVIRGAYPGGFTESGLISIKDGGTLNISEGGVVNLADNANDYNLAIDNKGTLILSGAPTISGVKADIYLGTGKVITINGALTNSTPYSVNAVGQVITSGWATNMSGKTPGNYFASAKSGYSGVVISAGEVKLVQAVVLSETDNTAAFADRINGKTGTETYVSLTRSLTSAQYNTFCLPFALTNAQMQEVFGAGYDLEELTSSSLDGDLLNMEFTKCTDLEAGKPYLLQPAVDVENPTFEGVTITETEALSSETDYVYFKAIYSPTLLTDGDESLLFLGADNTLFSPAGSTGSMKGFRGYFETKNGVKANAIRAHITKKTGSTTGIGDLKTDGQQRTKVIRNGQLLIIRGENTYNAQGQLIK